jgi:fumarylacetoacetase
VVTKASNSSEIQQSWINVPEDSDFSIYNIPFGVFQIGNNAPRCCTAIGEYVVDLSKLAHHNYFKGIQISENLFQNNSLNAFIRLGKETTCRVRERLIDLFSKDNDELQQNKGIHREIFFQQEHVTMLLPISVGDYTDFYSSKEHATNVGSMFRDPNNALLPNWRHLPVAYHGRASSIVISGTPLVRPQGQFKENKDDALPVFGLTQALDYELEVAFVIGKDSVLGETISVDSADEYIFGFLLFNDWSARDIQSWEYVPLGPFLSKNFMSSVSPWIVTAEALRPYQVKGPDPEVTLLPYLQSDADRNYNINLEVQLKPKGGETEVISRSNFKDMYWNVCQQLAHHTVNGCNVKVGDVMASGTISGPTQETAGSMLELTRNGQQPITLKDGTTRQFLKDGDTVIMKGYSVREGKRVGFGEVTGMVSGKR